MILNLQNKTFLQHGDKINRLDSLLTKIAVTQIIGGKEKYTTYELKVVSGIEYISSLPLARERYRKLNRLEDQRGLS